MIAPKKGARYTTQSKQRTNKPWPRQFSPQTQMGLAQLPRHPIGTQVQLELQPLARKDSWTLGIETALLHFCSKTTCPFWIAQNNEKANTFRRFSVTHIRPPPKKEVERGGGDGGGMGGEGGQRL
jgi:hypothetical protein